MSQEFLSVVTRKGQITIPVKIRQSLGLKVGDRIALVMENKQVCLTRSESVVARTAGILKSGKAPLSAEELRSAAEQVIADEVDQRSRG